MKNLMVLAMVCLMASSLTAKDGGKEKSEARAKKPGVEVKQGSWNEEKMGSWRDSRLGRFVFGMCRKSTDLCVIIFHEGNDPRYTAITVFRPDATPETFNCESYSEYWAPNSEGEEELHLDLTLFEE